MDENGPGHASPDLYFVLPNRVVVFEFKLSQCEAGLLQLAELYYPILREFYSLPVVGAMAFKWRSEGRRVIENPLDLVTCPPNNYAWPAEWHLLL